MPAQSTHDRLKAATHALIAAARKSPRKPTALVAAIAAAETALVSKRGRPKKKQNIRINGIIDQQAERFVQREAEIERLKRGEYVCKKCGLCKDSEPVASDF